jgi:hypothetical protein
MENDQDCSSRLVASSSNLQNELFGEEELAEVGSSRWLRMCPGYSLAEMVTTLRGASESYTKSGVMRSDGRFSILSTWDGVNPMGESSEPLRKEEREYLYARLSDILEKAPPEKYSLSSRACKGILRRAEKRGKELPEMLDRALQRVASEGMKKDAEPCEAKAEI